MRKETGCPECRHADSVGGDAERRPAGACPNEEICAPEAQLTTIRRRPGLRPVVSCNSLNEHARPPEGDVQADLVDAISKLISTLVIHPQFEQLDRRMSTSPRDEAYRGSLRLGRKVDAEGPHRAQLTAQSMRESRDPARREHGGD